MDAAAKLDGMANQIAAFFRPYPEAVAVAGVREHLGAFWTPAMRRMLRERAEQGASGLDPIVIAAMLTPSTEAASPGRSETAGPGEAGEIGASDAG